MRARTKSALMIFPLLCLRLPLAPEKWGYLNNLSIGSMIKRNSRACPPELHPLGGINYLMN
jgi:hypothetical protein